MKVILYMAMTANGYIAKEDDNTDWTSQEGWESFNTISNTSDTVIIGRRTYDTMTPDLFQKECVYIVITHTKDLEKKVSNIEFSDADPKEIITHLEKKGMKTICVAGGGNINSKFMQAGVINEIYLDIEPIMLGKGIQLFSKGDFEYNLELLESKKLNNNTLQLHYKVL